MLDQGDIIFVRGKETSIVDNAIKLGEEILYKEPYASCYVHVSVYIGNGEIMEAQGFRKSGPAKLRRYAGNYDVGKIRMTYDQHRQFMQALSKENGLPYDWAGIWWIIVKILTGHDEKYKEHLTRYCSKYIEWAAAQAGVKVNGYTPESLALDKRVTLIKASPTN